MANLFNLALLQTDLGAHAITPKYSFRLDRVEAAVEDLHARGRKLRARGGRAGKKKPTETFAKLPVRCTIRRRGIVRPDRNSRLSLIHRAFRYSGKRYVPLTAAGRPPASPGASRGD